MDTDPAEPTPDPEPADASDLGTVAVVGAGAMGAGIAQVAATAGHHVLLVDDAEGAAAAALERLAATLERLVDKGRVTREDAVAVLGRIDAVPAIADLPECDLVVEAVPEDLDLKQRVFAELADHQPSTTLLATNTSSIDLNALAEVVADPERVLGLHFFNPAPVMALVEVVQGRQTSRAFVEHAMGLMRAWGKTPVRCASTPGFIVNRVARPFYGEAQRMVEEGVADPATIDWVLREVGGFPMGPLELTDFIGQDVNLAVATSVWEQTGRDERYTPTRLQQDLVAGGHLGRKSGSGIYSYAADGAVSGAEPDEALGTRLVGGPLVSDPLARTVAMLVNEAVDLVHRGEAAPDDVDTAMRLGVRYPKGPIAWGREIGFEVVAGQIGELQKHFPGARYRPSPALTDGSIG